MTEPLSLAPGSINYAHDPRFWITEELPTWVHAGTVYHSDPYNRGILLRTRVVLPIRGCGNG